MKKTLTILASLLMLVFAHGTAMAQRGPAGSPKATIKQMIGSTEMELIYSRPSISGRDVWELVTDPKENGDVWRTGANTNTIIAFNKDVTIGGQALKAGRYSLYTIPAKGKWTIIINSVNDKWGTNYDEANDVLRFTAPATTTQNNVETFRIDLTDFDKNSKDKANLEIAWGNISVKFPIVVKN